jgi:hypothetical protein
MTRGCPQIGAHTLLKAIESEVIMLELFKI